MPSADTFENELRELIDRYMTADTEPQDIVDALSKQASLVIDQNNLELEIELRSSRA